MNSLTLDQDWALGQWGFSWQPDVWTSGNPWGSRTDPRWILALYPSSTSSRGMDTGSSFWDHQTSLWGSLLVEKGCLYEDFWLHTWAPLLCISGGLTVRPLPGPSCESRPAQSQGKELDTLSCVCSHGFGVCLVNSPHLAPIVMLPLLAVVVGCRHTSAGISPLLLSSTEKGDLC